MRIMIDANIIVSAILFPNSIVANVLKRLIDDYSLVLSDYTICEVEDVFNEKFGHRIAEMKEFLHRTSYELFIFKNTDKKYPDIRDIDDLPVLASAIESNVDVLITGDKDFADVKVDKPMILSPRKFAEKFLSEY